MCATRKDSELEWLVKDHPETNPITIKPETVSHAAEQFSWVPLPYCSPPGCPFPIKSLALSVHVSSQTIHFLVLDKSPVLGPGRDSPSCNNWTAPTSDFTSVPSFTKDVFPSLTIQLQLFIFRAQLRYWKPSPPFLHKAGSTLFYCYLIPCCPHVVNFRLLKDKKLVFSIIYLFLAYCVCFRIFNNQESAWYIGVTIHFTFLLECNCFTMLCWFLLYNNVNQLYVCIYPLPLGPPSILPHPTHLSHPRAPSWAPYTTQQAPTSYLFYIWQCIYVAPL